MIDRTALWDRIGALTGIVFVVLTIVSVGLVGDDGGSSDPGDSAVSIARVFDDRADNAEVGYLVGLAGLAFFFFFLGYLKGKLQKSDTGVEWLTATAFGGGLIVVAALLIEVLLGLATTIDFGYVGEPVVAKTIFIFMWNWVWVVSPPAIAFTAAASVVIIRTGALPAWTGWLGVLTAVTLLMPWIGIMVMTVWVLIVSIVMSINAWRPASAGS